MSKSANEILAQRVRRIKNPIYESVTSKARFDKYKIATAGNHITGPFSNIEDHVIITWKGRDVDLACALGRTYYGVRHRKKQLIAAGFIAPKIRKVEGLPTTDEIRAALNVD